MSNKSTDEEPSIEEILASIRDIISDDEEEAEAEEKPLDNPVREKTNDVFELSEDDLIEDDDAVSSDDLDSLADVDLSEEDDEDEPLPAYEMQPDDIDMAERYDDDEKEEDVIPFHDEDSTNMIHDEDDVDPHSLLAQIRAESQANKAQKETQTIPSDIMSAATQGAALDSLQKLTNKMPINRPRSYDGVTLEDIVREMLNPMLREWMDRNLPPMIERIVQKELEKLARRALDE